MIKIVSVVLIAVFLSAGCATGQFQASAACVTALADLGILIAEGVGAGGTFDLSSVLAAILANGGDISAAVAACSALFTARTQQDLKSVVATKVASPPSARASGQKIPVPAAPIKVRIR